MKPIKILLTAILLTIFFSCGGGAGNEPANAEGFSNIEKELKREFGSEAYYTDIYISHDERIGNIVSLTVTEAPESLKMGQWNLAQNTWTQTSEVSLEVPNGTQAKDFMFQLNDNINLTKLGELIEQSANTLTEEKSIETPSFYTALVKFPKNGDSSKMEYSITMKPENGGASFHFYYDLNGALVKMDY